MCTLTESVCFLKERELRRLQAVILKKQVGIHMKSHYENEFHLKNLKKEKKKKKV